jgi:homoserine O-acetyltransferase
MDFAARFADRVRVVIPIASGLRATTLSQCLNFEQIFAIEEDPDYMGGDYYDGAPPSRGLVLARMISQKTFVSLSVLASRARGEVVQPDEFLSRYTMRHRIESYMMHAGRKFISRFDANSYLRIVNAWQSFDLPGAVGGGDPVRALAPCRGQRWLLFSISSDVCFYPEEQGEIARILRGLDIELQHITVNSEKGHDSFLLEPELYAPQVSYLLGSLAV